MAVRKNVASARQTIRENNQNKDAIYSENGTITDITLQNGKFAFSQDGGKTYDVEIVKTKEVELTNKAVESINGASSEAASQEDINIENAEYMKQLQQNKIDAVKAVQRQGIGSPIPNEMFTNAYLAISYVGEVNNQTSPTLPIDYDEEGLATFAVFYIPNSTVNGNAAQQIICMTPEQSAGRMFVRTAINGTWEDWKEMVNGNSMNAQFEIVNEKLDAIKGDTEKILELNNYDEGDANTTKIIYNGTAGTNIISGLTSTGHKIIVNDVVITESSIANQTFELPYNKNCVIQIYGDCRFTGSSSSTGSYVDKVKFINVDFGPEVTALNENCFYGYTSLETVNINRTQITEIPNRAFYGCTNLVTVTVPASVTTLGNSVFYGCTNLENLTFENANNVTTVGTQPFYNCSKIKTIFFPTIWVNQMYYGCGFEEIDLTGISIPDGVQQLFSNNTKLTTLNLGGNNVGISMFSGCSSLSDVSNVGNTIGNNGFSGCPLLTSFSVFSNAISIGDSAFSSSPFTTIESSSLVSIGVRPFMISNSSLIYVNLPNLETLASSSGSGLFHNCSNLTTCIMPKATSIPYQCFYGCSSLSNVDLSSCEIFSYFNGMNQFYNCTSLLEINLPKIKNMNCYSSYTIGWVNLQKVTLGADVEDTGLNGRTFGNCTQLTDFTILTTTPPTISSTTLPSSLTTIKVPSSAVAAYQAKSYWSTKTIVGV